VIKSIADKETDKIWNETHSRKLPADIQQRALNKLAILDAAKDLNDLRVPPSNRLEALTGDRKDFYSIRINGQWRICFRWDGGNAYDVGIQDYH
jgi:proteic killer suppression protein